MMPTAPSSPSVRAPRRRMRMLACALALAGAVSVLPFAAQSASAQPEAGPHSGPWNGVDVYITHSKLFGMAVRTFSNGHQYCVELSPGWNAVPIEAPVAGRSGAELAPSKSCTDFGGTNTYIIHVRAGERWHVTNDSPRCVPFHGGPAGQCTPYRRS
ncbi:MULTISPECIES: hypothetical protein [Clavibacter]|uniref:Secreted protein n=1 Tax=Clavibacter tessellarius TaxID=31965 RepID=A0A154UYI7_9MICO|nr:MULTISPECIES: hypothetical protein [Clavibacter]KZC94208.1 hypothetical protein AWH51_14190 [Clavibacter michiganensis subsp. tessellarius]MDA3804189.1 hypothetical protein [Clavibacter sp. CT19]